MVALVLAAAAVAVFLVLPGALAAWLLGLRLWIAFALGAPLHLGFLALLMQLFGWAQIAWALPGVVVADLVALALLAAAAGNAGLSRGGGGWAASGAPSGAYFAWDWRLAPLSFPSVGLWRRNLLWIAAVLVALCAAGVFQAAPFLQTLPNAGAPTQSFDAMFHYSGAKIIAQTQDASWRGSLDPLYVTPGINKYYPNQWHALVALFAPWASLSLVSNALLLALTCVVWPLGVGLMADYAFCASSQAYRNWAVPLAILLSPAPLVFPYYLGVLQALYPYVLALTWWPGALWGLWRGADLISLSIATRRHHAASAAASSATATSTTLADAPSSTTATAASSAYSLRSTRARHALPATAAVRSGPFLLRHGLVTALLCLAALQAQPSTIGFLALAGFFALAQLLVWRALPRMGWVAVAALALLGGIGVPAVLGRLGMKGKIDLAGDNVSLIDALSSMAGWHELYLEPWWIALPLGVVALVGLLWHAWRRRDLRFVGLWAAVLALVAATKVNLGPLTVLTALWYGAYDRIGAGIAFFIPVFAAGALAALPSWQFRAVSVPRARKAAKVVLVVAVLVAAVYPALVPAWQERKYLTQIAAVPGFQFHSPWVSLAEFEALTKLRLPAGSVIIGDPSAGEGLAYFTGGNQVFYPHLNETAWDEDHKYLAKHFREIRENPRVCQILRAHHVNYFYQDLPGTSGKDFTYPGLHDVDTSGGFTEVAQLDQARLYRIDACG